VVLGSETGGEAAGLFSIGKAEEGLTATAGAAIGLVVTAGLAGSGAGAEGVA
jgi:hypothetical protein